MNGTAVNQQTATITYEITRKVETKEVDPDTGEEKTSYSTTTETQSETVSLSKQ